MRCLRHCSKVPILEDHEAPSFLDTGKGGWIKHSAQHENEIPEQRCPIIAIASVSLLTRCLHVENTLQEWLITMTDMYTHGQEQKLSIPASLERFPCQRRHNRILLQARTSRSWSRTECKQSKQSRNSSVTACTSRMPATTGHKRCTSRLSSRLLFLSKSRGAYEEGGVPFSPRRERMGEVFIRARVLCRGIVLAVTHPYEELVQRYCVNCIKTQQLDAVVVC